ncbi:unnamed protein product [Rotaria sp. Silwood1]|nr:unnamed protein product [Rotaria sp. Silwood1]CAF1632804.1 unnamed protein product [Rotaria sp. Silwood1]
MTKRISFVRGFRIPKEKDINEALGNDASFSNEFKRSFNSLPHPTSDLDWLANYKEKGQTYKRFLNECPFVNNNSSSQKYIYLTLLDNDNRLSLLNIDRLIDYTQRFFQMEIKLLPLFTNFNWNEKKKTWICTMKSKNDSTKDITLRTRYNSTSEHSQICVHNILNLLKTSLPNDARCLVAITLHDLYSDESDLFIAGLCYGNRSVAIFSFFRYDPRLEFSEEFWYDWKIKKIKSKLMSTIILLRSCRLLTHEIGHLLGIDHCIYYACLMNGSGHLEEDFSQPLFLCPIDLRKLLQLTNFDFIERYEQLLDFCIENQFKDDINILKKRIEILKNDKTMIQTKKNKDFDYELQQKSKRLKKKYRYYLDKSMLFRIVQNSFTSIIRQSSNFVRIFEVGPRDGLQNEKTQVSTSTKIEFINRLSQTGLKYIEVTSFVSPKWIPQMNDHVEVLAGIDRLPDICYSVLTPNIQGLNKVLSLGKKAANEVAIFSAASEIFSKKNINCSIEESFQRFNQVVKIAHEQNLPVRGSISCTVGCPYEGKIKPSQVVPLVEKLLDMGCYEVALADTIGVGTPKSIHELLKAIYANGISSNKLAIHCHDTYGQAIANIAQALEMGIRCIDSSVAGLGGCPYAKGATGNVATEDVLYLLHGLGYETGIDLNRLIDVSQFITNILKRDNMSKVTCAVLSKRQN